MKQATKAIIISGAVIAVIIAVFMLARTTHTAQTPEQKIHIVAAENVWGNIAAQIGGDHASIISILSDTSADPHLFEPTAQSASALASADIVVVNGLGYDDAITKTLGSSANKTHTVITAAHVLQTGASDNPHLWYDIPRVGLVATEIANALVSKDNTHADAYRKNLQNFMLSLQPLLSTIDAIAKDNRGAPVAYTERLPEYLVQTLGLTNKTPSSFASAIENGTEPTPADQSAFEALIAHKQIRALLYNSQTKSAGIDKLRQLADQNHIAVIPLTELLPNDQSNYQTWQQSQLDSLLQALAAK